jgi:hypothetical protein
MSDMTPQTPPPEAPAPASTNEVVINQAPTNKPLPVGSQAPEKVEAPADTHASRAQARKEAIQAAFKKSADLQAEKPLPKAADAKPGHNQPPEETVKEPQPRDQGRFAQRGAPVDEKQQTQSASPAPPPSLPETAPYRDPPPRLSDKAKADWAGTSESVRGDVHRLIQETEGIHKRYRGDYETMETIRPYHELATKQGTTLQNALSNYVGMEQKLRTDPIGGLDTIVANLNLQTPDGRKITLRDIAHHIVSRTPEQMQMMQHTNAQTAQSHQMAALRQKHDNLETRLQQMQYDQRLAQTRPAVDAFADTHPRFDELSEHIKEQFNPAPAENLEEAYRRANLLNPATHAAQTRPDSTPAQTRPADKSISGAPTVGPSNGTLKRPQKIVSRREAIENAVRHVNGSY